MDLMTMIVVIVLVVLGFSLIVVRWGLAHEEKRMAMKAGGGVDVQRIEQVLAVTKAELVRLRERVQVLENDDARLAAEIEKLRTSET